MSVGQSASSKSSLQAVPFVWEQQELNAPPRPLSEVPLSPVHVDGTGVLKTWY